MRRRASPNPCTAEVGGGRVAPAGAADESNAPGDVDRRERPEVRGGQRRAHAVAGLARQAAEPQADDARRRPARVVGADELQPAVSNVRFSIGTLRPDGVWHWNTWYCPADAGEAATVVVKPVTTSIATASTPRWLRGASERRWRRHELNRRIKGTGFLSKGVLTPSEAAAHENSPPLRTDQFFQITSSRSTGGHRLRAHPQRPPTETARSRGPDQPPCDASHDS